MEKHIHSKVFNEQTYFNKVARHHLSEMGPLTDAFLSQGYNFLTRKLLLHRNPYPTQSYATAVLGYSSNS